MIFVTVGHQMPFDRLIKIVDDWQGRNTSQEIFAQIGRDSIFKPKFLTYKHELTSTEFNEKLNKADLVISHAGTGTILKTLQLNKPIFVIPRLATLKETRNEHQSATVKYFKKKNLICSFNNETEFEDIFKKNFKIDNDANLSRFASDELISFLKNFLSNN